MNKLNKQQKNQLMGVAGGTLALMVLLWYFGVTAKQDELSKTEKNTAQMMDTLRKAEGVIHQGDEWAQKMEARTQLLDKRESTLSPERDDYAWIITTMNDFLKSHKGVNIFNFSRAEVTDNGIFPIFPYKWATFHLGGAGYYHDLGKFMADLENDFPYFRVQNLAISANSTVGADPETLTVTFELVVPVNPNESK